MQWRRQSARVGADERIAPIGACTAWPEPDFCGHSGKDIAQSDNPADAGQVVIEMLVKEVSISVTTVPEATEDLVYFCGFD